MQLEAVQPAPGEGAGEYAYRLLRKNIIWAVLCPGECVSPVEVAEKIGSSRTPVQTAFARLSGDGLLRVYPQRGSYVTKIDAARLMESVRTRGLMDQAVLSLICRREVAPEDRLALESNLLRQQLCWKEGRLPEAFELDNVWHELAYRMAGMEHSYQAVQSICADHQRMRFLKLRGGVRAEQTVEEHAALNAALFAGDAALCRRLGYEHVQAIAWDLKEVYAAYPDYFENWEQRPDLKFEHHTEIFYFD